MEEDRPTMIKPFMLYFDSLGMMDTETAKLIALYPLIIFLSF